MGMPAWLDYWKAAHYNMRTHTTLYYSMMYCILICYFILYFTILIYYILIYPAAQLFRIVVEPRAAFRAPHPVSVEQKNTFGEEDASEDRLSEHQIRALRAVSAAGLQGNGSRKKVCFLQTPV